MKIVFLGAGKENDDNTWEPGNESCGSLSEEENEFVFNEKSRSDFPKNY